MDSTLTLKEYTTKKRKQIYLQMKDLYWLFGKKSKLSLDYKNLIYNIIMKIWTYGIELWGCASKSIIYIIQRNQSEILRMLTDASIKHFKSRFKGQ